MQLDNTLPWATRGAVPLLPNSLPHPPSHSNILKNVGISNQAPPQLFSTAPTAPTPALDGVTLGAQRVAFQPVNPAAPDSNNQVAAQVDALANALSADSGRLISEGQATVASGGTAEIGAGMVLSNDVMGLRGDARTLEDLAPAPFAETSGWSSGYKEAIAEAEKQIAMTDQLLASNPNPTALTSGAQRVAESLQKVFEQTGLG
jgi:hypothetical protein